MEWFWGEIEKIFKRSGEGFNLILALSYVDDARTLTQTFPKGTRFSKDKFIVTEEEPIGSAEEWTRQAFQEASNSVAKCLQFTTELQSDFDDFWLPTLDMALKILPRENVLTFRYYEKPMTTNWVLPAISEMERHQKFQILANDLVRRLRRTDPLILESDVARIIDSYDDKLEYSGYSWEERLEILES